MDINVFVQDFIAVSNAYDVKKYLEKWHQDAVLNDPSVGHNFKGHSGIKEYFDSYFIGYRTQTRLVKVVILSEKEVHLEVEFTGAFPGGKIGGILDFILKDDKIAEAKADLI